MFTLTDFLVGLLLKGEKLIPLTVIPLSGFHCFSGFDDRLSSLLPRLVVRRDGQLRVVPLHLQTSGWRRSRHHHHHGLHGRGGLQGCEGIVLLAGSCP
jgi:hypothetical protein